jgi:hypothetical protein|tara:strand:+ start:6618 stop:6932 length:315 start_codon:yes stop_codon:yes gene_type:complete
MANKRSLNKGIEKACMETCSDKANMYVPWYLMAAYAYYVEDDPILTDDLFDRMAKRILTGWDDIDHVHKTYLTKDMLEAGTYLGEYPPQVEGALKSVRDTYRDR